MTKFDKLVATDLAALATDSHHAVGTFDAFVPAPRAARVPRPKDPIRVRVNRIAALAAGGTVLACAAGFAKATITEPFFMFHHVAQEAPLLENAWFLGFAGVALVATAFLLAHRIAAHVLEGSREWRTRARRLGDVAFGVTAVVWTAGWLVWMIDGTSTWSLEFASWRVDLSRGHMLELRADWWIVLAGGLACALVARAIAVFVARSKQSSDALALCAKLVGVIALVTIFALPEFWRTGGAGVLWGPFGTVHPSPRQDLSVALFHIQYGWTYVRPDWFDPEQRHVLIGAAIALGVVVALTVLCVVERYTKRRSRLLAVFEHRAVMTLAILAIPVAFMLQAGACDGGAAFSDAAGAAVVILAISSSLRGRRASLKT